MAKEYYACEFECGFTSPSLKEVQDHEKNCYLKHTAPIPYDLIEVVEEDIESDDNDEEIEDDEIRGFIMSDEED